MRPTRAALLIALAGALATAPVSAGARLAPTGTAVPRGGTLLLVGTGFGPPIEFCNRPVLRVDGRAPRITGRIFDDVGGWAIRIRATQRVGRHVAVMTQTCRSGNDGSVRRFRARAGFRILR